MGNIGFYLLIVEPGWASLNRAILLCDECCSIHRSLGRHVSHVKSLQKGIWNPNLLSVSQNVFYNLFFVFF